MSADGAPPPTRTSGGRTRHLPSGTVTFLFTDIEGSTRLLHELGEEEYAEHLARHRAAVRGAVAAHGGTEVDTQGDAFFIAFPSAAAAVAAATAARDSLAATGRIRVRMGLHTGTPHLTDEGYVGVDVHRGARIGACAHGGQIVVSAATAAAAGLSGLRDLGEHRLKDFDAPVPLYQVGDETFPPLKTISNTNLPTPASALVGRDEEAGAVASLVEGGGRLVSLTGPGGTGKTRLAIAVATELITAFRAGVFWVPLATLRDPALVLPEIARVLGADEDLVVHIADRRMLLLVDNLEQVVDAAPGLARLVSHCPNLVVLVTTRERLRVTGEVEYAVAPLRPTAAVELFCERAGVPADDDVRELCDALDDLPLAIELAAARAAVLSPRQVLDRLSRRLDLFKGGRDADPRQQTLRATIEWSWELLDEPGRQLLRRLAAFRGGCTLDAAEAVADADLDDLQSLVDKSLVRRTDDRFWMLETIHDFALQQLRASADHDEVTHRHAVHYLDLLESLEPALRTETSKAELDTAEAELANVAAGIDVLGHRGQTQLVLRFVAPTTWVWSWRGYVAEGRARVLAALAADPAPTQARANALVAAADLSLDADELEFGRRCLADAAELYDGLPDTWWSTHAQYLLAVYALHSGEPMAAEPFFLRALEGFRRLGDHAMVRSVRRRYAWMFELAGDLDRSTQVHLENLAESEEAGDQAMEATTLSVLSGRAIDAGQWARAVALAGRAMSLHGQLDSRYELLVDLHRFARVLAGTGRAEAALALAGAVEAQFRQHDWPVPEWVQTHLDEVRAAAEPALAPGDADEARRLGDRLTTTEAVALARSSTADLVSHDA